MRALQLGFAVLSVAACTVTEQLPTTTEVASRADSVVRDLVARDLFQGAAVIAHGDRVVYSAGYGWANRELQLPFTPDTPMDGASIAKTFTAAGLLLLSDEKRLDLNDPVAAHLSAFPYPNHRVIDLLTHAAGLPDYEWFDTLVVAGEPRTNDTHLGAMAQRRPALPFAPGAAFAYDNVAYDMAAMVIERVAGTSYAEFISTRFARPLRLNTFVRPARFADWVGARTRGYRRVPGGWELNDAYDLEGFYGADNIYVSAVDLQRWAAGYRGLMGEGPMRRALTPGRLVDGSDTGISVGSWYVSADGAQRYYTGHHNGFYCIAYADDARNLSVAWVANDTPPVWLLSALPRALIALAEGRDSEPLTPPPAADTLVNPTGRYDVPAVGEVVVERVGERLAVRVGGVQYQAFEVQPGVHYLPGVDVALQFAVAANGRVVMSWNSVYRRVPSVERRPAP